MRVAIYTAKQVNFSHQVYRISTGVYTSKRLRAGFVDKQAINLAGRMAVSG